MFINIILFCTIFQISLHKDADDFYIKNSKSFLFNKYVKHSEKTQQIFSSYIKNISFCNEKRKSKLSLIIESYFGNKIENKEYILFIANLHNRYYTKYLALNNITDNRKKNKSLPLFNKVYVKTMTNYFLKQTNKRKDKKDLSEFIINESMNLLKQKNISQIFDYCDTLRKTLSELNSHIDFAHIVESQINKASITNSIHYTYLKTKLVSKLKSNSNLQSETEYLSFIKDEYINLLKMADIDHSEVFNMITNLGEQNKKIILKKLGLFTTNNENIAKVYNSLSITGNDEKKRLKNSTNNNVTNTHLNKSILIFLSLALSLVGGAGFYSYKRRKENKLSSENNPAENSFESVCIDDIQNTATTSSRNEILFKKIDEYLKENKDFMYFEFDRKTLAKALATNETYLYNAIKEATGKTIQEYINSLRIEMGTKMLSEDKKKSIDSIACECGFKTSRTFYRLFREQYNMSPSEYRASLNNNK